MGGIVLNVIFNVVNCPSASYAFLVSWSNCSSWTKLPQNCVMPFEIFFDSCVHCSKLCHDLFDAILPLCNLLMWCFWVDHSIEKIIGQLEMDDDLAQQLGFGDCIKLCCSFINVLTCLINNHFYLASTHNQLRILNNQETGLVF